MIHSVKCTQEYFESLLDGSKTFEVRKNDRSYEVGDYLAVNEIVVVAPSATLSGPSQTRRLFTGRCLLFEITYVLTSSAYVVEGCIVLGIKRIDLGSVPDSTDRRVDVSSYGSSVC